ncbi:MAG: carbonate dehydratase [Planctomycetota bacterium]
MKALKKIFEQNAAWAEKARKEDPEFFDRLAAMQKPEILWIGCADSRVPANQICGMQPGEVFVHRNVANLVVHTDINCLSVLQYAVEVLKVKHVIVCGHYGCGGVLASLGDKPLGLIDNWIRNIRDVLDLHYDELEGIKEPEIKGERLVELNVAAQVANLGVTTIVQDAWARGQDLTIHGWVYSLKNGLLKDLDLCISNNTQLRQAYRLQH